MISEFLSRLLKVRKAESAGTIPPTFPAPPISATNSEYALRIDTVYACVTRYAKVLSTLPKCIKDSTTHEEAPNHPAYKLLNDQPNSWMDAPAFWSYIISSILLTGNAYARIVATGTNGRELYPISASAVRDIKLIDGKKVYLVDDFVLTDDEVLHFVGETVAADTLRGVSVIQKYALMTMQHAEAIERYAYESFKRGTNLNGVVEVPEMISEDEKKKLYNDLKEFHSGYETGGGMVVLDAGKKISPISITPNDAAFIASENFSVERICRWFDVPTHVVQNGQQTAYNSAEASFGTWKITGLTPFACRLEKQINRKLLGDGFYLEIDFDELLRPNVLDRYNANIKACGRPWLTVNEVREEECLPAIDGGDELFTPGNISNPSGLDNGGGDTNKQIQDNMGDPSGIENQQQ